MDKNFNIRGVAVYAKPANHDEVKKRTVIYARTNRDGIEGHIDVYRQIEICKNYINSRENLELSHIYMEYGLSAINVKQKNGFKAVLEDAKAHKFDIIITPSTKVFSRNMLYLLRITNELLKSGINTYFVKENISMKHVRNLADKAISYYSSTPCGEDE